MLNKKLIIALGFAGLLGIGILGVNAAKADDAGGYPPIIEKLVERFGLNEDEVKTFFDEERQERHQMMLQNKEERLDQAVADGVITDEQRQALAVQEHRIQQEVERENKRRAVQRFRENWLGGKNDG